ncbi:MAG: MoaD/ThiS family protein [Actinobacteria bacterium]|nr:MoaD/ThiS family protein [Actinomycetota bacterium]
MAVVLLPGLLASEVGGQREFELDATTVGAALRALPVAGLVLDETGAVRPLVHVYVDGERERDLDAPLAPSATIRIVAAIAGGSYDRSKMVPMRLGGWANLTIVVGHLVALGWAWTAFRWVDIEVEMRELADQSAALPYLLTLLVAAFFLIFGLYGLSAAGDLRRLPLLRPVLGFIAVVYLLRATLLGGIQDVLAGDVKQVMFAAIALLIGLCYASGFRTLSKQKRMDTARPEPSS